LRSNSAKGLRTRSLTSDRLVEPPARVTEILEDARRRLLGSQWQLAIVVTDLPLRDNGKPVSRLASRTHGVALVSLPALGPLHVRPRPGRALVELVAELLGRVDKEADDVLRELTAKNAERIAILRPLFVTAVLFSHLRLLLGMVRANRPWRLVGRLYTIGPVRPARAGPTRTVASGRARRAPVSARVSASRASCRRPPRAVRRSLPRHHRKQGSAT
jgi:hypothetical protein